jgi:hypothetical protein
MAATAKTASPTEEEIAARRTLDDRDEVDRARGYRSVTQAEGRASFDRAVRNWLDIGGDEFIRRWDAGEVAEWADKAGYRYPMRLALLSGLARDDA